MPPPWRMSAPVWPKKRSARLDAFGGVCRPAGAGVVAGGQAVDLVGVEDGVALEEGDRDLLLLAVVVGFAPREGVGVDDERALLAAADLAAEFGGLPVSHPQR